MATNPLLDFYFSRVDRNKDEKFREANQQLQRQQLDEQARQFLESLTLSKAQFAESQSQFGKTFEESKLRADQAKQRADTSTDIGVGQAIANNIFAPGSWAQRGAFNAGGQTLVPINQRKLAIEDEQRKLALARQAREEDYNWLVKKGVSPLAAVMMQRDPNAGAQFYGNPRAIISAVLDPTTTPGNMQKFIEYNQALSPGMIETPAERALKFSQAGMNVAHTGVYGQQAKTSKLAEDGRWLLQKAYDSATKAGFKFGQPEYTQHIVSYINKGIEDPQVKQAAMQALMGESSLSGRPPSLWDQLGVNPAAAQPASNLPQLPANATPEQREAYQKMMQILQSK